MTPKPFAVRIFLADGTVDGVKIIAKSKWSGRALVIPRECLAGEENRQVLKAAGVCLLIDPSKEDDQPSLMIAVADPVIQHLLDHADETELWTSAIVVTAKKDQLNLEQFAYIAARLTQLAGSARSEVAPRLADEEQAEAEEFLAHMLSIYPVLGLTVFDQVNSDV